ncbi:MAG: hypothetical protein A2X01_12295 [Bacteroidetes bacterium GWF2_35_48]|nr:MAG: hypothetical protein A2X01_12295 [Bacteroidetes bacterium GWF2_35_48]OFZ00073.1 MAG: hypothetical protein A2491_15695 [Bacteroidetes bacterium RIFOXYC12_FULL_35_7]
MILFNKIFLFFLSFLILFGANAQTQEYFPSSTSGVIIKHKYYSLSYSPINKQAEWVMYMLTEQNLVNGIVKRKDFFRCDPLIKDSFATLADYKKSGYDRGHLAPAGDMKIDSIAMSESFFLSNMSPQAPSFNRGIWKNLESQVRDWAKEYDTLYVVTGGILKFSMGTIGLGAITVPKYFYKVILNKTKQSTKIIALILPNEAGTKQLNEYTVTVDSLEKLTGIDFFSALTDSIENQIESKIDLKNWNFDVSSESSTNYKNKPPVYCKGINPVDGSKCENIILDPSGYCQVHINQVDLPKVIKDNSYKLPIAVRCTAITQKETQCKRMTHSPNQKCWQHGGN